MAIIYHNYLLAIGNSSDVLKLETTLKKTKETAELLSQNIIRVYYLEKPRARSVKDFGNCGSFLSQKQYHMTLLAELNRLGQ